MRRSSFARFPLMWSKEWGGVLCSKWSVMLLNFRYARKHFTGNPTVGSDLSIKDVQTAMGLLAFSPSTTCRRYQVHTLSQWALFVGVATLMDVSSRSVPQKLFSVSRWQDLVVQFRQENFALFQLSPNSMLTVTLQAGLSALKTPYVHACTPTLHVVW